MWHTVFVLVLIWLRRRTCVSPASRCLFYQEKNSEQALVNGYPVRLRTKWRLQLWTVQIYVATGISTCSKHESSTLIYSHWIFIWFPACRHHSSTLEYVSICVMPPVLVTSIDTSHLKMIENEDSKQCFINVLENDSLCIWVNKQLFHKAEKLRP